MSNLPPDDDQDHDWDLIVQLHQLPDGVGLPEKTRQTILEAARQQAAINALSSAAQQGLDTADNVPPHKPQGGFLSQAWWSYAAAASVVLAVGVGVFQMLQTPTGVLASQQSTQQATQQARVTLPPVDQDRLSASALESVRPTVVESTDTAPAVQVQDSLGELLGHRFVRQAAVDSTEPVQRSSQANYPAQQPAYVDQASVDQAWQAATVSSGMANHEGMASEPTPASTIQAATIHTDTQFDRDRAAVQQVLSHVRQLKQQGEVEQAAQMVSQVRREYRNQAIPYDLQQLLPSAEAPPTVEGQ